MCGLLRQESTIQFYSLAHVLALQTYSPCRCPECRAERKAALNSTSQHVRIYPIKISLFIPKPYTGSSQDALVEFEQSINFIVTSHNVLFTMLHSKINAQERGSARANQIRETRRFDPDRIFDLESSE